MSDMVFDYFNKIWKIMKIESHEISVRDLCNIYMR